MTQMDKMQFFSSLFLKVNIEISSFPGIEIGVCGDTAIRLRPALIFGPKHAEIFLNAFQSILKEKSL